MKRGQGISEADFNAALQFGRNAAHPLIAAQRNSPPSGRKKREITANIVPDRNPPGSQEGSPGDRFVPRAATPGNSPRSRCKAIQTERRSSSKIRRGKGQGLCHHDAFYFTSRGRRPQF